MIGGALVSALLPPEGARAIGRLLYDYQTLVTGAFAIAVAYYGYLGVLEQMSVAREIEASRQEHVERMEGELCT